METIDTKSQKFRQMMTLFTQTKQIGFKHTAAFNASKGRTESTKDLTEPEVDHIISELKKLQTNKPKFTPKDGDSQRKKFLAIAGQMRWGKNTAELKTAINDWCLKQKFKKEWMKLTVAELNTLLTIFETKVLTDYYKNLN
ncbi:MAG: hypothetical protein EOO42_04295 [Flavobacteriales bacterium]|nr:MAG: hypothetical protein EOO42_04295 [Flavobacteriales bacterium]